MSVSDAAALSGNERNRTFQVRFTQVLCPWYQPEIVPLVFRVPGTTVQEFLCEVAGGVSLTRLDFAKHAVPTVPQLFEDRASVVLGGNWHEAYGDAILVPSIFGRWEGLSWPGACPSMAAVRTWLE